MSTYFAKLTMENMVPDAPAFEALKQAPVEIRLDGSAAVYYVSLHIDGSNANWIEEDMAELKFAFDGFGEAKLFRVDEVGAVSTPGFIVAIPNDGTPPLLGALEPRVTIQKLPKESHSPMPEGGDDGDDGGENAKDGQTCKTKSKAGADVAKKGKKKGKVGDETEGKSGKKK